MYKLMRVPEGVVHPKPGFYFLDEEVARRVTRELNENSNTQALTARVISENIKANRIPEASGKVHWLIYISGEPDVNEFGPVCP